METIFVKCPNCGHAFDSHDNFWWGPDEDNHPTVENYRCPECGASTEPSFRCSMCPYDRTCTREEMCPCCDSWNYDDFTEVVPGAQENKED